MKRINLFVNIALAVAVAVLYVLFFISNKQGGKKKAVQMFSDTTSGSFSGKDNVVYVNIDTVFSKYSMYIDLKDQYEQKVKKSENELKSKEKTLQDQYMEYQTNMQKGVLLRSQAMEIEKQLAQGQQNLVQLQENLRAEIAETESVMLRSVMESVTDYLNTIQPEYNFHYVLGTTFGGTVLYSKDDLDISNVVIEGLNKVYKENLEKKKKKDSR